MIGLPKLLTDKDAALWPVGNVGIDMNLQLGKSSWEKALNFKMVSNISRDIAFLK